MFEGKDIIVFDLETQKSFQEVGKSKAQGLEKLKVSVCGVYEYLTNEYKIYEEGELMDMEKRFQKAELLIGFNSDGFDLPVLAPYFFTPIDQFPSLDLMTEIESIRGHRVSLDSVAKPTLKIRKSGSGLDAIQYWKEGKMDKLKEYCLDDVRITKEVFEFGCEHGEVQFTSSWDYKTHTLPVTWQKQTNRLLKSKKTEEESFPSSLF